MRLRGACPRGRTPGLTAGGGWRWRNRKGLADAEPGIVIVENRKADSRALLVKPRYPGLVASSAAGSRALADNRARIARTYRRSGIQRLIRDAASGTKIAAQKPLGRGFMAEKLSLIEDLDGNGQPEFVVAADSNADGLVLLKLRDTATEQSNGEIWLGDRPPRPKD